MDDDRVLRRNGVEIVAGGVATFGEKALIPTAPDDPLTSRRTSDKNVLTNVSSGVTTPPTKVEFQDWIREKYRNLVLSAACPRLAVY